MLSFETCILPTSVKLFNGAGHAWWRHQMETFSALLAICAGNSPVTGEFPSQRPVTQNFDVFFDLRLNKRLNKKWWGWWFVTPSRPLWRHCNGLAMTRTTIWVSYYFVQALNITTDQRKHQSSASLAFVRGIHRWLVNSPHKGSVTRKMFSFDDVSWTHPNRIPTDTGNFSSNELQWCDQMIGYQICVSM